MSPCPSPDVLQRFLDAQLDEAESLALEAHVESCTACQDLLEKLLENRRTNRQPVLRKTPN